MLNKIYKGTSICMFNKFHLLKVKMHTIKKIHIFMYIQCIM